MMTKFKVGDRVTSEYQSSSNPGTVIIVDRDTNLVYFDKPFFGGHSAALRYNEKYTLPSSYWISNRKLTKINHTLTLWDI